MSDSTPPLHELADQQEKQGLAGWRVLVVDDEPYNVDLLRFELEDRGLTVVTASDGRGALDVGPDHIAGLERARAQFDAVTGEPCP